MEMLGFERAAIKRRKGQDEYVIWSIKANAAFTLHEKSEVLYLLRQEFNPSVTALSNETHRITTQLGIVYLPIIARHGDRLKVVIFDTPEVIAKQVSLLCEERGFLLDVITTSPNSVSTYEFWNLMEMHQWLIRWGSTIREKDIQLFARSMRPGHSFTLEQQASGEDPVSGITMAYELVRRGRLQLQDISSRRIYPESIFSVNGGLT